MQRSVFLGVTAEQVWVSTEQQPDDLQAAIQCRQVQRSLKLVVPHGGVGQLLQQQPHYLGVAVLGSTVQRRLIVVILLGANTRVRGRAGKTEQRQEEKITRVNV